MLQFITQTGTLWERKRMTNFTSVKQDGPWESGESITQPCLLSSGLYSSTHVASNIRALAIQVLSAPLASSHTSTAGSLAWSSTQVNLSILTNLFSTYCWFRRVSMFPEPTPLPWHLSFIELDTLKYFGSYGYLINIVFLTWSFSQDSCNLVNTFRHLC